MDEAYRKSRIDRIASAEVARNAGRFRGNALHFYDLFKDMLSVCSDAQLRRLDRDGSDLFKLFKANLPVPDDWRHEPVRVKPSRFRRVMMS